MFKFFFGRPKKDLGSHNEDKNAKSWRFNPIADSQWSYKCCRAVKWSSSLLIYHLHKKTKPWKETTTFSHRTMIYLSQKRLIIPRKKQLSLLKLISVDKFSSFFRNKLPITSTPLSNLSNNVKRISDKYLPFYGLITSVNWLGVTWE